MHARWITHHPFAVLAFLLLATAIQGYYAAHLGVDFTLEGVFVSDAPERVAYRSFRATFGPDDHHLYVFFRTGDLFAPAPLAALERLTTRLERAPGAHRVLSLARFSSLAGPLAASFGGTTVAQVAGNPAGLARFRDWALAHRMLRKGLVSADGRTACVVIEGDLPSADRAERVDRLLAAVRTELAAEHAASGYDFYLAGIPTIEAEYNHYIKADQQHFIPLIVGIFLLLCALYFGSLRPACIILATVGTAAVWILGVLVELGRPMGVLTCLLPNMILIIGIGDSIFILAEYVHQLTPGRSVPEAMEATLRRMTLPCFLTSATSAIGFSTLCTTNIGIVQEFGWLSALGLMLAYVASLTLPASVVCALGLRLRPVGQGAFSRGLARYVAAVASINRTRRGAILAVGGLLVAVSAWGATRVRVESSWFQDLKEDSPVTQAHAFAAEHLGGLFALETRVHAGPAGALDPAFLGGLAELQRAVEREDTVSHSTSPADLVREALRAAAGRSGGPDPLAALRPGQAAAALLLARGFGAGPTIDQYVSRDQKEARLSIRLRTTSSVGLAALTEAVRREAARLLPAARIEFTGKNLLGAHALAQMIDNMTQSLGLAMVLIFACMGLMLRSLRMGLLSMIPNLLPMLTTFAFMGATGISVSFSTMTIFSISLGVAVDNTIHFLSKFKDVDRELRDVEAASTRTLELIGTGMVLSGMVLIAGFATIGTSHFGFTANFGLLGGVTMLVAVLADLHVTPMLPLVGAARRAVAAPAPAAAAAPAAGGTPA